MPLWRIRVHSGLLSIKCEPAGVTNQEALDMSQSEDIRLDGCSAYLATPIAQIAIADRGRASLWCMTRSGSPTTCESRPTGSRPRATWPWSQTFTRAVWGGERAGAYPMPLSNDREATPCPIPAAVPPPTVLS